MASADGRAPRHLREHVAMAWSIGCLMSYLAETYRRQMFANHKLAADAAARELMQAKVRSSHGRGGTPARYARGTKHDADDTHSTFCTRPGHERVVILCFLNLPFSGAHQGPEGPEPGAA